MASKEDYGSPSVHPGQSHHWQFLGQSDAEHLHNGTFGSRDLWMCHRDGCKTGRDTDPVKRQKYLIQALDNMLRDQGYTLQC